MDARARLRRLARSRPALLAVGALVLAAWGLFLRSQLAALQNHDWQIAPVALLAAVAWGAAYFAGLALCWGLLLRHLAGPAAAVTPGAATKIWLYSMMTRYVPGNVWHVLSRVALAERLRVARTHVLSSALIEQLLTLLGALALGTLLLPLWPVVPVEQGWLLLLLPLGLALLHPRLFGTLLAWLAVRLQRPELGWRYGYRDVLLFLAAYAAAMACAGLGLYAVLGGLTAVRLDELPLVVGAAALAWAAGYLSFLTPSGLGVREAALVLLLAPSYPLPVAVVGSLVFRLALTLGELLAVLVAWLWDQARPMAEH